MGVPFFGVVTVDIWGDFVSDAVKVGVPWAEGAVLEAGEGDDSFKLCCPPGALRSSLIYYLGDFVEVWCSLSLEFFAMPEDVCRVRSGALALWVIAYVRFDFSNM